MQKSRVMMVKLLWKNSDQMMMTISILTALMMILMITVTEIEKNNRREHYNGRRD